VLIVKQLAVVGALLAALFAGGAASKSGVSGVAYFRENITATTSLGRFPGATQVRRSRVLLLRAAKTVGTGGIACIVVGPNQRECFGTYVLPQGRIKVLGETGHTDSFQLLIIGGTGVYAGSTGVAAMAPGLVTFYLY
jgi:hypothetical protein